MDDKLEKWLETICKPPSPQVANLDYWDLLLETRIIEEAPRQ